jgi:hypothetical protein
MLLICGNIMLNPTDCVARSSISRDMYCVPLIAPAELRPTVLGLVDVTELVDQIKQIPMSSKLARPILVGDKSVSSRDISEILSNPNLLHAGCARAGYSVGVDGFVMRFHSRSPVATLLASSILRARCSTLLCPCIHHG